MAEMVQNRRGALDGDFIQQKSRSIYHFQGSIEEVTDFIPLVSSLQKIPLSADETGTTSLDPRVETQLTEHLTGIACMYRNNPAHNFYLASHVALSAQNLLSCLGHANPLVAFCAVVFSALVQDVDNTGLTNEQLVSENPKLAAYYQVSVLEQNSIDLAWDLLMDEKFSILRQAICHTDQEASLFRRLGVTLVLTTDIVDPGLRRRRQERWEQAFSSLNIDNKDDRQYTLALYECPHYAALAYLPQMEQVVFSGTTSSPPTRFRDRIA